MLGLLRIRGRVEGTRAGKREVVYRRLKREVGYRRLTDWGEKERSDIGGLRVGGRKRGSSSEIHIRLKHESSGQCRISK